MNILSKLNFALIALFSFQLQAQDEITKNTGAYDAIHISGPFEVTLTNGQEGSIAGSGDVSYKGNPHKISQDIAGSGKVRAN